MSKSITFTVTFSNDFETTEVAEVVRRLVDTYAIRHLSGSRLEHKLESSEVRVLRTMLEEDRLFRKK